MEKKVLTPNWDILKDPKKYQDHLTECFNKYDTDKSGFLDLKELQEAEKDVIAEFPDQKMFIYFPEGCLEEFRAKYFNGLDTDKDGKISKNEFSRHIHAILEKRASVEKDKDFAQQQYVNSRRVAEINILQHKSMIESIESGQYTCGDVSIKSCEAEIKYWEDKLAKNETIMEAFGCGKWD
jgi:hypothetical protein